MPVLPEKGAGRHRPHRDKLFDNGHFGKRPARALHLLGATEQHFTGVARTLAVLTETR